MAYIGSVIAWVAGIVVLVKLFQYGGFLKGLIGLVTCNIYTFIWGWLNIKNEQWKLKNWMYIWTILLIIGIAIQLFASNGGQ